MHEWIGKERQKERREGRPCVFLAYGFWRAVLGFYAFYVYVVFHPQERVFNTYWLGAIVCSVGGKEFLGLFMVFILAIRKYDGKGMRAGSRCIGWVGIGIGYIMDGQWDRIRRNIELFLCVLWD